MVITVKLPQVFWELHIHNWISMRYQTWKGGSRIELDRCLWNTDAIRGNKVQIWKVPHVDPAQTKGHVNYEQPFDELTVQVWLVYDHPHFKHVQVRRNYDQTDRTDGRSN